MCKVRCTERERERERSLPHCVTAAARGEEEDERVLPLRFLCYCISPSYSVFYSLWAVVVFSFLLAISIDESKASIM